MSDPLTYWFNPNRALDRAGHWKHEWTPLDPVAAKEKFHGHVPKSWHSSGGGFPEHAQHARNLAAEVRSRRHGDITGPGGATDQVLHQSNEHLGNAAGHLDQAAEHLSKGNAEEGRRSVSKARKSLFMYHANRNETRLKQMDLAAKADKLHSAVMEQALRPKASRSDTWAERFNPNHSPAGSATGGQFAAASGGKSGTKGKDTRPVPSNQHPVGRGEHGKRVSDLQSRLNALGFKPPLKVDGIFGPKTLAAVRAFQKSHGLKVDGLVGPKTTAALRAKAAPAKHAPAHTAPHKAAPKPAAKTVKRSADPYGHEHYAARSRLLREQAGLDW